MKNKIILIMFFSLLLVPISQIIALSEDITQINFTSEPQTIEVNTASSVLTTQTQKIVDTIDTPEPVDEKTTLNYVSNSNTGRFSNASITSGLCNDSTWSDSNTFTLTLSSGSANKGFCYKDSTPGTHEITVTASVDEIVKSWEPATQEIVVNDSNSDVEQDGEEDVEENQNIEFVNIHLEIINGEESIYNADLSVEPCDSDNNPETPDTITAYCAILQSGLESSWNWAWAPGAFVDSINEIEGFTSKDSDGNDVYHYWSWSLNDEEAIIALNQHELDLDDLIFLEFINPIEEIEENVEENPSNNNGGGSSVGNNNNNTQKEFLVEKALEFLLENKEGVSISILDWVAIASGAGDNSDLKSSMMNYLNSNPINSNTTTDNERRAVALMALGINPYSDTEVNYIKKIVDSFNNDQLGDEDLVNDDIFGLIVLQNAGYDENDEIVNKIISYIISEQSGDGSWGSIDMTGAGIMALKDFDNVDGVKDAISKAKNYLIESQNDDGGFDNISSTSWAIQALSLSNSYDYEVENGIQYLANHQEDDGGLDGIDINSRVWATAYAIPAVLKLSWNEILNDFEKPEKDDTKSNNSSDGSSVLLDDQGDKIILDEEEIITTQNDLIPDNNTVAPKRIYTMYDFLEPETSVEKNELSEDIKIKDEQKIENLDNEEINLLQASAGNTGGKFIQSNNIIGLIGVIIAIFFTGFVLGKKV